MLREALKFLIDQKIIKLKIEFENISNVVKFVY